MSAADTPAAQRRGAAAHVFVEPDELRIDGTIPLDDDALHHLSRVLRLRDGQTVSLSDGHGGWRPATVVGVRDHLRLEPGAEAIVEPRGGVPITLATAIPKGDRFDWLVQNATELGVDRLQLLHAERSVVRWKPDRCAKNLQRAQRISDEAARQSRRLWKVEVKSPVAAADVLPGAVVAEPGGRQITFQDVFLAVGPEGGWTMEELNMASDQVELGENILRVETAGLVAITLCVVDRHKTLGF